MNKLKETVALALEALKKSTPANIDDGEDDYRELAWERRIAAIKALKELQEQPEQEPVAWMYINAYGEAEDVGLKKSQFGATPTVPLYTAPPQREWQGLTDEEIGMLTVFDGLHHVETPLLAEFARTIEAKLKEKNA